MNLSIQTQYFRESLIFARVLRWVCALLMSACTNLLTARASSHPLALKCLNWQSLHEFSLNTDINVFCSGLTSARAINTRVMTELMLIFQHMALALNKSEWFVPFFFFFFFFNHCCCNVLGSQNGLPSTETHISRTLFILRVIYNKPCCRCIVRFKLNRGPSACRTVCGEPYGSISFPRTVPPHIIYTLYCQKYWLTPF